MDPVKIQLAFVDFKSFQYVIKNYHYITLLPNCFKYDAEYTMLIEDDIKGKTERYCNISTSYKRSSIIGVEKNFDEVEDAWSVDLIISGACTFRIWFKTADKALEFKEKLESYISTEVFEMKHLLS